MCNRVALKNEIKKHFWYVVATYYLTSNPNFYRIWLRIHVEKPFQSFKAASASAAAPYVLPCRPITNLWREGLDWIRNQIRKKFRFEVREYGAITYQKCFLIDKNNITLVQVFDKLALSNKNSSIQNKRKIVRWITSWRFISQRKGRNKGR